jgi:iron(III) transport system permease protein
MLLNLRDLDFWQITVMLLSVLIFCPLVALILISFGDSEGLWSHLLETVLIRYVSNTLFLMIGVSVLSLIFGIVSAWILTNYRFRFSKLLEILMLLPMACPAYLVAYAYTDFFEYAGPIQGFLRELMGWKTASDYIFPEIRSLGGAIFVLSSVLYPYIYLLAKTAFKQTPNSYYEVTQLYNRNIFWYVSLPLARPAIVAGLALVCMEVVSDFGTVEYFALETLTLGIFNVWIGMNNINAAAQISTFTFIFILLLLLIEIKSRAGKRFNDTSSRQTNKKAKFITGIEASFCIVGCLIPVSLGFFIPVLILLSNAITSLDFHNFNEILKIFSNTLIISLCGAFCITIVSTTVACTAYLSGKKYLRTIANFSASGYAFPGTMLAIGILVFVGVVDHALDVLSNDNMTLFLSGTMFMLLFAYIVKFQAVGYGAVLSGLTKTSPNLVWASRTLGLSFQRTVARITIPLIKKSIIAGGVLAFVDIMKELPITLLLRPFDFETLATFTYQFAHDELMGQASVPALLIILVGLIPVIFLNKILRTSI